MLILIFLIGILFIIFGIILEFRGSDIVYECFSGLGTILSFISILIIGIILFFYPYNIDKKLAMYEEENQKIEAKIKDTVRVYMSYEQETYKNLVENAELTTLLIAYPDLNSNELVKYEIEQYKTNSDKIKEIKEKQIYKSTFNWWLYFGK